jgi:adenosine deaminase
MLVSSHRTALPERINRALVFGGRLSLTTKLVICLIATSASTQYLAALETGKQATSERRVEFALAVARKDRFVLRAFLANMPKGADLHSHLSGAVYAESRIRAAIEDNLCVDLTADTFSPPPSMTDEVPSEPVCGRGEVPVAQALKDQNLYVTLIDAFSMHDFVPSPGITARDHFFAAFEKFGHPSTRHVGEWLDDVATRAAQENTQYLELMANPSSVRLSAIVKEVGWRDDFKELRDELLARGLRADVDAAHSYWDQAEATRQRREDCGKFYEHAACKVLVRYIYQVNRDAPKNMVFAQALLGFDLTLGLLASIL